jgi:C4-dicarboxylate transporter DctM subunit
MEAAVITAVIVFMLLLIFLGQEVAFAMLVAGLGGLVWLMGTRGLLTAERVLWNSPNNSVLIAVPLFILMGDILLRTELSGELFRSAGHWLGGIPGGLFHGVIAACAIFAAISGSSPATSAAIGTVSIPEMEVRKYDTRIMLGSVAAAGTLGILIPPSITFIVYGAMVSESIGRLFIAGIIPGILMAVMFMAYVFIRAVRNPSIAPEPEEVTWGQRLRSLAGVWPALILIIMVLGSIYFGVATPTEAAALGATTAAILGLINRKLTWKVLKASLFETVLVTVSIMIIFVGASLIAMILSTQLIPQKLTQAVIDANVHPYLFLTAVYIIYILLGCFFDPNSILVLTLPVVFPAIKALGFDPIWFGVIVVVLIQIGMITPPVGLNLYVMKSIGVNPSRWTL